VPDTGLLQPLLAGRLALELLIEGEDGSLAGLVDVSRATASAGELGGRLGNAILKERGGAAGRGAAGGLGSLEGVSGTASARVGVLARVWVRLGDLVLGRHCRGVVVVTGLFLGLVLV